MKCAMARPLSRKSTRGFAVIGGYLSARNSLEHGITVARSTMIRERCQEAMQRGIPYPESIRATPGIDRRRCRRDEFPSRSQNCFLYGGKSTESTRPNYFEEIEQARRCSRVYVYVYANLISFLHFSLFLSFHFFFPLSIIFPRRARETLRNQHRALSPQMAIHSTRTLLPLISPIHTHNVLKLE